MIRRLMLITTLTATAVTMMGCATTAPSKNEYSRVRLALTAPRDVLREADAAIQSVDLQVGAHDAQAGSVRSRPKDVTGESALGRHRTRKWAEVVALSTGSGSDVYCRVVIEQYRPQVHALSRDEQGLSDTGGGTPIDRGEARTEGQDGDWEVLRRDKLMERKILSSIEGAFAAPASTPNAPDESK